jgi:hypothetical protein
MASANSHLRGAGLALRIMMSDAEFLAEAATTRRMDCRDVQRRAAQSFGPEDVMRFLIAAHAIANGYAEWTTSAELVAEGIDPVVIREMEAIALGIAQLIEAIEGQIQARKEGERSLVDRDGRFSAYGREVAMGVAAD